MLVHLSTHFSKYFNLFSIFLLCWCIFTFFDIFRHIFCLFRKGQRARRASANDFLMQFQADIVNTQVRRPACIETTALGAAYLAGLAVGYWKNRDEIRENWQIGASFAPEMDEEDCKKLLKGWHRAVKCALAWAEDEI